MKIWMLLLLLLPICLQAAILHVAPDSSQIYTSIQSAVNASAPNDTILVYPGTYYENVEINQRSLTLASLEMTTGDSTYIAQTFINGNQTGSCIRVIDCDSVIVRGLYLTNGNGSLDGDYRMGGGLYIINSSIGIINCRIIENRNAHSGAGCTIDNSHTYLSGTTIAYNHNTNGAAIGAYGSNTILTFDPINRCSVYLNTGVWGSDIKLGLVNNTEIYLDKFTVPYSEDSIGEYIYSQINTTSSPYSLFYNTPMIIPQYADFYVSPTGNDNNNGHTPDQPLKTIALALIKVKADSLHPQTIHLANGIYSQSLNGQYFPLNLRSYITIQGESETGTIIDGDSFYPAFGGYNSEQKTKISNFTIRRCSVPIGTGYGVIYCVSRIRDANDNLMLLSMEMENVTIKNCYPLNQEHDFELIRIGVTNELVMRNINIEDCTGSHALILDGCNIIGDNIRIHNFRNAPGDFNHGTALHIMTNNSYGGIPNVFTNLEVTECSNNANDLFNLSAVIFISGAYVNFNLTENYFINATVANNWCQPIYGGAVTLGDFGKATFINSIFSNNCPHSVYLRSDYGDLRVRFLNTLLNPYPNGDNPVHNVASDNVVEWYGTILDTIPDFVADNPFNSYYLNQTSPCIDAGTTDLSMITDMPGFAFPSTDLAGNPRIYGSQIDLGAYEWCGVPNEDEHNPLPDINTLSIYPNPFVSSATFSYNLEKASDVTLVVYNTKGQRVKRLVNSKQTKGVQTTVWDGKDENGKRLSSGIYFVRLIKGNTSTTRKIILIK